MMDLITRMVEPIKRRILLIVGRGVIHTVKDSQGIQRLQVEFAEDEVRDAIERIQEYGFTSAPLEGAEAAVVFIGGNREQGLILGVEDRRYRLKGLQGGEVALYTDEGDKIHLKRGRQIEILTHKLKVQNADHELVSVLLEALDETITTVQAIIDARTVTLAGPQPLLNPTGPFPARKAALEAVKTKLQTFKV